MKKTFKQFLYENDDSGSKDIETRSLKLAKHIFQTCHSYLMVPRVKNVIIKYASQPELLERLKDPEAIKSGKNNNTKILAYLSYAALFHGSKSSGDYKEISVRDDRKPRDTTGAVHDVVNKYMKDRFGIPYRSSSIFTTGDLMVAGSYNQGANHNAPWIVIPYDGWSCLTSRKIHDMTVSLDPWHPRFVPINTLVNFANKAGVSLEKDQLDKETYADLLMKFLKRNSKLYTEFSSASELEDAFFNQNEIMLHASKVFMLNPTSLFCAWTLMYLGHILSNES